jgi:Leucine-rich repeat (LRR) protein
MRVPGAALTAPAAAVPRCRFIPLSMFRPLPQQLPPTHTRAASALLTLPAAATNWSAATAALPGAPWRVGTQPCGNSTGAQPWRGITCDAAGQVTALELASLGLGGTLPPNLLAALPALRRLDLSGNRFSSSLPPGWASATLGSLQLGSNRLSGGLPASWGGALPALTELALLGNNLTGAEGALL